MKNDHWNWFWCLIVYVNYRELSNHSDVVQDLCLIFLIHIYLHQFLLYIVLGTVGIIDKNYNTPETLATGVFVPYLCLVTQVWNINELIRNHWLTQETQKKFSLIAHQRFKHANLSKTIESVKGNWYWYLY